LFDCVVATAWDPEIDGAEHVAWARALHAALQPWSAGRVYGNILTADEAGRSRDVYGANLARLADVKAEYDPRNQFRRNQNIKPAPQAVSHAARPDPSDLLHSGQAIIGLTECQRSPTSSRRRLRDRSVAPPTADVFRH
jgi:Ser/Thr protein kinase RdoA (MazF antagonist)